MTQTPIFHSSLKKIFSAVCSPLIVTLLLTGPCFSQAAVTVSPKSGPPTSKVLVSGGGFSADAKIAIYFDRTSAGSTTTDSSGAFSNLTIKLPASATPGQHQVSAQESGGASAHALFGVNTNWPTVGFTPAGDRWNPYENTLNVRNVGSLKMLWSYPLDTVPTSVTVANGAVYFGTYERVCALSTHTGTLLWCFQIDGPGYDEFVDNPPTAVNGVVYAPAWTGYDSGHVYALHANTGALLWSYPTGGEVLSSPAVVNGVVYFGSEDANVYALNASTGALLWMYQTGYPVYSSPAVVDGVVYTASGDNNVYALDASTGALLWMYQTGDEVLSSPAVADGVVYIGSFDANLYALNASTGALLWSFPTGGLVWSSPAVANGVVYIGSSEYVYALNASTGALLWSYNAGYGVQESPAVAHGVVFFGAGALNASTGALLWHAPIKYPAASPTVADGVVFLSMCNADCCSGPVYAFGLPAGEDAAQSPRAAPTQVH